MFKLALVTIGIAGAGALLAIREIKNVIIEDH